MCGKSTGKEKYVLKWILTFTLLTKSLQHNADLDAIMQTVDDLQRTFSMGFDETLEHAIFMRRFLIHNKLTVSEKQT